MKIEIESLRVLNCGPLRDLQLDFADPKTRKPRPFTFLAGPNGSGKTTILELIVALAEQLDPEKRRYRSVSRRTGFPGASVLDRAEYAQLNLQVDNKPFAVVSGILPADAELPERWFGYLSRKGLINQRTRREEGTIGKDITSKIAQQRELTQPFVAEGAPFASFPDLLPSIIYLPYLRFLPAVQGTKMEMENTRYDWVYRHQDTQKYQGSLNSYLVWLEYSEPSAFNAVQTLVGTLYPDRKTLYIDRKRLKVIVRTQDGGEHGLDQLSSGEQNLLIVLIDLRRRLLPHSIVLIDEIENSLHPAFQHRLGQALRRLREEIEFQLILTSHAPAFLEIFGADSTLVLPMRQTYDTTNKAVVA